MAPTLFVFGDLCVDIVAVPKSIPRPGDDATLERLDIVCGGAAYNCAIAAVNDGARVKVIGLTGDDEFGRVLMERLRDSGVDTSLVQLRPKARTGAVLSIASADGERTLYSYRGVNSEAYGSLACDLLKTRDALYLSGYSLQEASSAEAAQRLKRQALSNGVVCLLDPSFQSAASLAHSDFLHGLDWITPNRREAELITDSQDPERAAATLRAMGVANVVITLGADGCLVATRANQVRIPSVRVPELSHSTGAGDAFCGGLLAALLNGCDAIEAARRGTRAAASAIQHNASGIHQNRRRETSRHPV